MSRTNIANPTRRFCQEKPAETAILEWKLAKQLPEGMTFPDDPMRVLTAGDVYMNEGSAGKDLPRRLHPVTHGLNFNSGEVLRVGHWWAIWALALLVIPCDNPYTKAESTTDEWGLPFDGEGPVTERPEGQ